MISIRKHYPEGAALGHSFFNFFKYSLGKIIILSTQTYAKGVKEIKKIKKIKKMIARIPPHLPPGAPDPALGLQIHSMSSPGALNLALGHRIQH